MSKVLVIGSNSPSGATFCSYLLKAGYEVIATSRSEEKQSVFLPYKWNEHKALTFKQIDLNNDLNDLASLLSSYKPKYIVNFASQSMVGQSWEHPVHWMQTNVVSLVNLLELLRQQDYLERYVHFTTPEVYGSTDGWVKESMTFDPSTPYASSRAAGDMNVALWQKTYGLPAVLTRAANIYGEGQQLYRIIPRAFLCCLTGSKLPLHGGGYSERAFIHCDDTSHALDLILQNARNGESYHISPYAKISIRNLVAKICDMAGQNFEDVVEECGDRLGKDQNYLLDSSKIKSELGWVPEISLENGLERCMKWVKDNLDQLRTIDPVYIHKP